MFQPTTTQLERCRALIQSYSRVCCRKSKRSPYISLDDCISEGNVTLVKAMQQYDVNCGTDFVAYFSRALANRCGHITYWSYKKEVCVDTQTDDEESTSEIDRAPSKHSFSEIRLALSNLLLQLGKHEKEYVKCLVDQSSLLDELIANPGKRRKIVREALGISYAEEKDIYNHVLELVYA